MVIITSAPVSSSVTPMTGVVMAALTVSSGEMRPATTFERRSLSLTIP